ncbi:hypothetical protein J8C02_08850 [Chloracidobacterium sp. MS 40/45]|uniref:hypothetical protein n=1 Tax=Chloracidobacterium aggregatum TaxID=2851959 RepID=UPI001B8C105C|nr:hypothetical protein [Chloracidobacterium aggregatum]QUV99522.1 hypothetical protein J8C02_08850 [Chloracidobacterium sp. MS 40/45]
MSARPPLPAYGSPPPYGRVPPPGGGGQNVRFLIQLVLGFVGTLAYGTLIFFLVLFTALSYVPQIITELIFFGGSGLGIIVLLFVSVYFRWWGVLAGAALAFLVPFLLVGACAVLVVGTSIFGAAY